jgi:hypothetical protein
MGSFTGFEEITANIISEHRVEPFPAIHWNSFRPGPADALELSLY